MTKDQTFYRLPKFIFSRPLSPEAKILYALLLDRTDLSAQNGWMDPDGQVYIYFTLQEIGHLLGRGHSKVISALQELEASGLIRRKRQGQGRPTKIYVTGFDAPIPNEEVKKSQKKKSRSPVSGPQDFLQADTNHTDKNQTELNKTDLTSPLSPPKRRRRMDEMRWVKETIQENIDYEFLIWDRPADQELIDGYVELMTEACCTTRDTVRVCGQEIPADAVRSRLMQLDTEHIRYVRDCLSKSTAPIKNIKAYTLAALYNAPVTMEQYYDALVSRDMGELG